MRIDYAWEKLMLAVHGMAQSPSRIQKRIADAYLNFHTLRPEDFPSDLQPMFKSMIQKLTSGEPNGNKGSLQTTTEAMSDQEATEIARTIVHLYDSICAQHKSH